MPFQISDAKEKKPMEIVSLSFVWFDDVSQKEQRVEMFGFQRLVIMSFSCAVSSRTDTVIRNTDKSLKVTPSDQPIRPHFHNGSDGFSTLS